jgi:hypothetical protein
MDQHRDKSSLTWCATTIVAIMSTLWLSTQAPAREISARPAPAAAAVPVSAPAAGERGCRIEHASRAAEKRAPKPRPSTVVGGPPYSDSAYPL